MNWIACYLALSSCNKFSIFYIFIWEPGQNVHCHKFGKPCMKGSVHACECANMQVCKHASVQTCDCANMWLCKHASVKVCVWMCAHNGACMPEFSYENAWVFIFKHLHVCGHLHASPIVCVHVSVPEWVQKHQQVGMHAKVSVNAGTNKVCMCRTIERTCMNVGASMQVGSCLCMHIHVGFSAWAHACVSV